MSEARILETIVRHASDYIGFYEATGYSASGYKPRVNRQLSVELRQVPVDLVVRQKGSGLALFRNRPEGMTAVFEGRARDTDLEPPAEPSFDVHGVLRDPHKAFNPRAFTVSAGNAHSQWISVYRSPSGTALPHAGALRGNACFDDGRPASWAVLRAVVTPTVGAPMTFEAQADIHGDFVLPLNRMPALNKDAPSPSYGVSLSVRADSDVSTVPFADPDEFAACSLGAFDSSAFDSTLSFSIEPGNALVISSQGSDSLLLQEV